MTAVIWQSLFMVEVLLKAGADCNIEDKHRNIALQYALIESEIYPSLDDFINDYPGELRIETARLLLVEGAILCYEMKTQQTALRIAVKYCDPETTSTIIKYMAKDYFDITCHVFDELIKHIRGKSEEALIMAC